MRLPANFRSVVPLLEDLFFAAGIVSFTTSWFMLRTSVSPGLFAVPADLMLGLTLLVQGLPVLAITAAAQQLRRRSQSHARVALAALAAISMIFIGLHVGGLGFQFVAGNLSGGIARWSALGIYLAIAGIASFGVVKLCLRFQQMAASIFRTLGLPGLVLSALLPWLLASGSAADPAYALTQPLAPSLVPSSASSAADQPTPLPPVFVLVFDELSRDALLDRHGQLDSAEFPNFARLAEGSVTFSDMRSNFFNTTYAVPSLVESLIPLTEVSELRLYMQFRSAELAVAPACSERVRCVGISEVAKQKTGTIFRYLIISLAEDLIPGPFSALLRGSVNAAARVSGVPPAAADSAGIHLLTEAFQTRFLDDLRSESQDNAVTVFHTLATHHPYVLDAGGRLGMHPFDMGVGGFTETEFDFSDHVRGGASPIAVPPTGAQPIQPPGLYDAYRAQIRYGDELLGLFLDTLEAEGLLARSIVIVTADHGLRPRIHADQTDVEVGDWTTQIPLFIRAPGLAPGISTAEVQYQDLAPTLFDLLELDLQSAATTTSAFASERPQRSQWFLVEGTWVHHRATDGTWPVVAALPELPELDRGSAETPRLSRDLLPCFAQPEDCTILPMLLAGTPEFEAAAD
jgi:hypothetical protein